MSQGSPAVSVHSGGTCLARAPGPSDGRCDMNPACLPFASGCTPAQHVHMSTHAHVHVYTCICSIRCYTSAWRHLSECSHVYGSSILGGFITLALSSPVYHVCCIHACPGFNSASWAALIAQLIEHMPTMYVECRVLWVQKVAHFFSSKTMVLLFLNLQQSS